jgi:hypothetical protein
MRIEDVMREGGAAQGQPGALQPEQEGLPQDAQVQPQGGQAPAAGAEMPGQDQATPEEQEQYERVVLAASEVLYNEKTSGPILQMLQEGADDPAQAIGQVAVMVLAQLDDKSNGTIPEMVIVPAAAEIVELVAELGQAQGLFQVDEAILNRAGQVMMIGVGEQYGIDPQEIQALMESMDPAEVEQMRAQQDAYANAGAPVDG